MPSNHELRRDHVLDQAIAAGKFGNDRRAHWAAQYDRDPAGTEQILAALASVGPGELSYPRELFPELSRERSPRRATTRQPQPAASAASALPAARSELSADEVAAWSRELFPEAVAAGAGAQRIVRCND